MAFSGPWVVWGRLGAPGEKKRENQMFLQDFFAFAPLTPQKPVKLFGRNEMKFHFIPILVNEFSHFSAKF